MRQFDWTDILFDKESQQHVLRHFSTVDDDYKKYLLENENVSENEIAQLLDIPGSKFSPSFVLNPLLLFNWLGENIPQNDLKLRKARCEIHFKTNKVLFPVAIK